MLCKRGVNACLEIRNPMTATCAFHLAGLKINEGLKAPCRLVIEHRNYSIKPVSPLEWPAGVGQICLDGPETNSYVPTLPSINWHVYVACYAGT